MIDRNSREHSVAGVFAVFLKLGLTSFGGPIAHLGYFREELVVRRGWLDDSAYTELIGLCQFLPGPASSQVAFAIGLLRAGYLGGLAAFTGFTLPAAALMTSFAYGVSFIGGPIGAGALHGLKLVAVAIVAHAVMGMTRTLTPDRVRASIAGLAALVVAVAGTQVSQILAIALGGLAGLWLCRMPAVTVVSALRTPVSRAVGQVALGTFFLLLVALPFWGDRSPTAAQLDAFYRAGALVFGGGHVVLPLLSHAFVSSGWVSNDAFLAGYAAAQAIPGPMFTFAAFLGVVAAHSSLGVTGAALGLVGIFLPGMLVLLGVLPFWDQVRRRPDAQALMTGVNAAVVGLLGSTLYNPLWVSSVHSPVDFVTVLLGFVYLTAWRAPPLQVVILGAAAGMFGA